MDKSEWAMFLTDDPDWVILARRGLAEEEMMVERSDFLYVEARKEGLVEIESERAAFSYPYRVDEFARQHGLSFQADNPSHRIHISPEGERTLLLRYINYCWRRRTGAAAHP